MTSLPQNSDNTYQETSPHPVWFVMADHALMLDFAGFEPVLSADNHAKADRNGAHIRQLANHIRSQQISGITDIVPSLSRLMVRFDICVTSAERLKRQLTPFISLPFEETSKTQRQLTLPICYEGDCAPDIDTIAQATNLSADEVIAAHLALPLQVAVMGFMPGLGYMTGVDERLTLPRRANPRTQVPARSVGIAMGQCVIYPLTSPGGWHLIGRAPIPLFDITKSEPILLQAGDIVRFERIDETRLAALEEAYEAGHFGRDDVFHDKSSSC